MKNRISRLSWLSRLWRLGIVLVLCFPSAWAQTLAGTAPVKNLTSAVGAAESAVAEPTEPGISSDTHASVDESVFQDGKDYFSYTIPIKSTPIDGRIEVRLFFSYECAYCLTAFDNLSLYQRLHDEQIRLILQPIATEDALFGPNVYYSLNNLDRQDLAELLLFDTAAEHQGKSSLVEGENLYHWLIKHNVALDQFLMQIKSQAVAEKAKEAVEATEKYGVFTSPFVVVGGQYVLTSSTLYNDDYTFAVMDFLISRILQQQSPAFANASNNSNKIQ
ncbi:thiol:disulfide interchange protein DsbA/DsbL [Testudinibacter sp. TR-2022]|uniref:thiol:disulfide interchange protein DsbA/DsbL n=1 Tax=Testudinibacter sp. TR-2022 TaxID=2585029 RepID=UPI00111AB219|nr:thiol:disulfide interchange protein DsbA/DsbL [Testudinibacter sp. TR-2022]TNH08081.1 thiol:disulfide interchange protein DsbA/DsbL [Pasteurellaceae bacterium Phil11]TNH24571.1 thiol:disulfide interchange protein DsbA/DsbL [Testudinibacter sp. TR-2022]